jgi:hypothetical protein
VNVKCFTSCIDEFPPVDGGYLFRHPVYHLNLAIMAHGRGDHETAAKAMTAVNAGWTGIKINFL